MDIEVDKIKLNPKFVMKIKFYEYLVLMRGKKKNLPSKFGTNFSLLCCLSLGKSNKKIGENDFNNSGTFDKNKIKKTVQ